MRKFSSADIVAFLSMSAALPCIKVLMKTRSAVVACEIFSDLVLVQSLKCPDNGSREVRLSSFPKRRFEISIFQYPKKWWI